MSTAHTADIEKLQQLTCPYMTLQIQNFGPMVCLYRILRTTAQPALSRKVLQNYLVHKLLKVARPCLLSFPSSTNHFQYCSIYLLLFYRPPLQVRS